MAKHSKTEHVEQVATVEKVGTKIQIVRVHDNVDANTVVMELENIFDQLIRRGVKQIVFDMGNVEYPNGSFIAMLINQTIQARRNEGELHLIHLTDNAKSHLAMFSPLTFLSVGTEEFLADQGLEVELESKYPEFKKGKTERIEIDATVDALNAVTRFVSALAKKTGMEQIEVSKLKIAVYEVCMNVVEHGYEFEPGNSMAVEVLWEGDRFMITVIDHGKTFDFYSLKPYDVHKAFDERRNGGFGLYIIQRSVDEIKYNSDPVIGNRLTLVKKVR